MTWMNWNIIINNHRGMTRRRRIRILSLPFAVHMLLILSIQLSANVLGDIAVCLQFATSLYELHEVSQVMAHKFVMLLPIGILPAIRPAIARGSRAAQKVIDMSPCIWPARHHLLRLEPIISLRKLGSSSPPSSGTGRLATLHKTKRNSYRQPFPDAEKVAPSLKFILHDWPIDLQLLEMLGYISLGTIVYR
jgi:hypothetical protein